MVPESERPTMLFRLGTLGHEVSVDLETKFNHVGNCSLTQSCLCKEALVNILNTTLRWASIVGTTLCILSHIIARRRYDSMGRGWPAALLGPLADSALFDYFLGLFYSTLLPLQYIIIMSMINLMWVPWDLLVNHQNWWWFPDCPSPTLAADVISQGHFEGIAPSNFAVWLTLYITLNSHI